MNTTQKARSLTAALITFGSLVGGANAAVTWLASDDGVNMTLSTDGGSLNIGTTIAGSTAGSNSPGTIFFSFIVGHHAIGDHRAASSGTTHGTISFPVSSFYNASQSSGDAFQFDQGDLYWDSGLSSSPGIITPTSSMTFNGQTVASVFGSNLDAGPVTLWTHNGTGDAIRVALAPVPEPSSVMLLGLGCLSLTFRRSRRN